jgi:hypothetical protein
LYFHTTTFHPSSNKHLTNHSNQHYRQTSNAKRQASSFKQASSTISDLNGHTLVTGIHFIAYRYEFIYTKRQRLQPLIPQSNSDCDSDFSPATTSPNRHSHSNYHHHHHHHHHHQPSAGLHNPLDLRTAFKP